MKTNPQQEVNMQSRDKMEHKVRRMVEQEVHKCITLGIGKEF